MRQKAFVSVDEAGTEAAAVTEADMRKNAAGPMRMVFDRPFIYLIREKSTGSILFIGTKQN
jgi:serpin B